MNPLKSILNDFGELLYPALCITCGERLMSQENYLCMKCWSDLPVTNFHLNSENSVSELFWGRAKIENATSLFYFRKGSRYQKLIHSIKYRGMKELGIELGKHLGSALLQSENFSSADIIVPVPLHPRKQKKRGFNQSEYIAKGIADILRKPVLINNICRKKFSSSQTKKNRYERWKNVEGIFEIKKPESLCKKHILLVDDVVTTGSTLEACAHEILKLGNVKISIATLAFADI
jgi:ComF family protein